MPSEQYVISKNQIETEKKLNPEEWKILYDFRKEIIEILNEEEKKEKKRIPKIFVGHLNLKDALMWRKINDPKLNSNTLNELLEYQEDEENSKSDLGKYLKELRNSINKSEQEFLALVISKIVNLKYEKLNREREILKNT